MKNMFHLKKIAAVVMAAALTIPGYTVFAEEAVETEVVETAAVEEVYEEPVVEKVYEEPVAEEIAEEPVAEEIYEEPAAEETCEELAVEEVSEEPAEETDAQTEPIEEIEFIIGEEMIIEMEAVEETESEAEIETEKETETENYLTEFFFENDEVEITAYVAKEAALPENAKMKATKLEEGSAAFEEAKAASIRDLGTAEDAEYKFYDVTFTVDGNEVELPERAASISLRFKNVQTDEQVKRQSVLHIEDTSAGKTAQDVTATAGEGNISSIDFTI